MPIGIQLYFRKEIYLHWHDFLPIPNRSAVQIYLAQCPRLPFCVLFYIYITYYSMRSPFSFASKGPTWHGILYRLYSMHSIIYEVSCTILWGIPLQWVSPDCHMYVHCTYILHSPVATSSTYLRTKKFTCGFKYKIWND